MSMLIRNLRSPQDLQKAIMAQDEFLQLALANESNIAQARRAYKMGEPAPLPIEDQRSKEELIQDEELQIKDAQRYLQDLGFRFDESSSIINSLGYNGALIINNSYPSLKKMFLSTYNIKTTTPTFFIEWFQQYKQELEESKGLTFGSASKFNALNKSVNDLKAIVPSQAQFTALNVKLGRVGDHIFKSALASKREILGIIEELIDAMPTDEQLQALTENSPENKQTLDKILQATANFPTNDQIKSILQSNNNNVAEIQKINNLLTGVSQYNLRELTAIKKEIAALASKPGMSISPVDINNPPEGVLTITDFNTMTRAEKQKYLTALISQGLVESGDVPNLRGTGQDLTNIYAQILMQVIKKQNINIALEEQTQPVQAAATSSSASSSSYDDANIPTAEAYDQGQDEIEGKGLIGRAFNIKKIKKNKVILGKGLSVVQAEPKYKEFGKFAIHWGQLMNNDILNVKYKSLGRVPSITPQAISDIFKDFIIDVMETGKVNQRLYNQVPDEEKKLFEKISIGAGLFNTLKLKKITIDKDAEDINRFNLLKGEYMAGNTNQQIIKELRRLIVKFVNEGRIHKTERRYKPFIRFITLDL
jgi:ribosomal protein L12E/L44/L45/RPP1/RPP2